jgi:3-oxoacyl-[acyl-carrier protein] reductase
MHEKPLLDTETAEFDRVLDINLKGTFLVGREAIRMMQQRGGRVILTASDLAYLGRETFSPYVASKHGVLGLMRSWAREFAPGILVNAICPGPIDTAMIDAANMTPEWRQRELDIPLARFGEPPEIAEMAVFLASDKSRYITGQGIGVNGGSVMC